MAAGEAGMISVGLFDLAQRFVGVKELPGEGSNPMVLAMLKLDAGWPEDDEVAWCSAFVNYICWLCRAPRSKSLRARSWLQVGHAIEHAAATVGRDVVIIKRGKEPQPGPEVIEAQGHVGFYAGHEGGNVLILGGNQGNQVSIAAFPWASVLGIRRLG